MTGTNHVATGALIGAVVSAPIVALPLAFVSHFVLDAVPHFDNYNLPYASKGYNLIVSIDALLILGVLTGIVLLHPQHWPLILMAAALAVLPDLMWLPNYIRSMRKRVLREHNRIMRFHCKMQHEHPWGLIVEALWFVAIVPLLYRAVAR